MNVFFLKECRWEYHFLKNEIFKKDLYNIKVNFIEFDKNTEINNNDEHNVIVSNHNITVDFLENMIKKLRPFTIFHLSDETGKGIKYYDLFSRYKIKFLFHQYNFKKIDYKIDHLQIPLGYATGFLKNKSNIYCEQTEYNKKYDFSFVGKVKSDRKEMLNKFSKNFKNNFIYTGKTKWSDPKDQNIKPSKLFKIYKDSLFVPIGRGNKSLDCFRLYEAITAGAIPVICGTKEEINVTFNFNNKKPYIIIADNWDQAVLLCKEIYYHKDKICNIINSNNKWLEEQIINISKKINELL